MICGTIFVPAGEPKPEVEPRTRSGQRMDARLSRLSWAAERRTPQSIKPEAVCRSPAEVSYYINIRKDSARASSLPGSEHCKGDRERGHRVDSCKMEWKATCER